MPKTGLDGRYKTQVPRHTSVKHRNPRSVTIGKESVLPFHILLTIPGTRRAACAGLPHHGLLVLADRFVVGILEGLAVAKDTKVAAHVGGLAEAPKSLLDRFPLLKLDDNALNATR